MLPAGVEVGLDEVRSLLRATTPGHEVVIEEWLEWSSSLCVSYLVQPGCAPTLVAVAEQVVDRGRGQVHRFEQPRCPARVRCRGSRRNDRAPRRSDGH